MTFLPNDVFKKILEFCDDRVERQQMIDKRNTMWMIKLIRVISLWEHHHQYMDIEIFQYYNEMLFLSEDDPPKKMILETNFVRESYTKIERMYKALGTYGKVFLPKKKILNGS